MLSAWFRESDPICVSADADTEELLGALLVAANKRSSSARKKGSVRPAAPAVSHGRPGGLSAREAELAQLAATGHSNAQIATQLYISPATVKWHLQRVFRKLQIERRSQLSGSGYFR